MFSISEVKQERTKKVNSFSKLPKLDFNAKLYNNIFERMDQLVAKRDVDQFGGSTLMANEDVSQKYISILEDADEFVKNIKYPSKERQMLSAKLYEFKKAFGGSMDEMAINERVLYDKDINLITGDKDVDDNFSYSMADVKNWPLFPWKPCPSDLKQHMLGDCWLESALANLAYKRPDCIENSLRDNGNGTVTGRIFDRCDENGNYLQTPQTRYYKVEKTIPMLKKLGTNAQIISRSAFSYNSCLWPEMIRKILIKHITDKEYYKKPRFTWRKGSKLSYEMLNSGYIMLPDTRIFEFFCPDVLSTQCMGLKININLNTLHLPWDIINKIFGDENSRREIEHFLNGEPYSDCEINIAQGYDKEAIVELIKPKVRKAAYKFIKQTIESSRGLICGLTCNSIQKIHSNPILGDVQKDHQGLVLGHSYTILGIQQEEYNGQKYYFVEIRDPGGREARYDTIDAQGKVQTQVRDGEFNDGVGRVEILEFLKYFSASVFAGHGDN